MSDLKGFNDCNKEFYFGNNLIEGGCLAYVDADSSKGYYYPYLVFIPKNVNLNSTIIVEGANARFTTILNDLDNYSENVIEAVNNVSRNFKNENSLKIINEKTTNYPILYPLFPRINYSNKTYYNHMLSSESTFNEKDKEILQKLGIYRTDLQLIEMIKDLKQRLGQCGLNIDDKVIMYGFSASAKFANRFTLLHPEIVKLTIAGALGGTITLPLKELGGEKLLWPIGIGNIKEITDEKLKLYKDVPQIYFQGMLDNNDCYQAMGDGTCMYKDILKDEEAIQLYKFLGKNMNDRWDKTKEIISNLDLNISLVSFNEGHTPDMANELIEEKLRSFKNNKKL